MSKFFHILLLSMLLSVASCRKDDIIFIPDTIPVSTPDYTDITGFYMLNEGNMGSNKASLDYFDARTGNYNRNIYAAANPDVAMELGDVGNDLQIYGSRMYAVINCSNKIEVMDAATAKRIGQIDIPNCRKIAFHNGNAYVTSYAGPVEISSEYRQLGYVARIDTTTLQITGRCLTGYQPDGLSIVEDKIYVANSGGYLVPNYEKTLSVIDINTFKEIERIVIAENLNLVMPDSHGRLWIASRGDYIEKIPRLYCYDTRKRRVVADLPVAANSMCIAGDSLYAVSSVWNEIEMSKKAAYAIVDLNTLNIVADTFGNRDVENTIKVPYCIKINPLSGEILVADARNYVNPGRLYCLDRSGKLLWEVRTGDIPAHIVFTGDEK